MEIGNGVDTEHTHDLRCGSYLFEEPPQHGHELGTEGREGVVAGQRLKPVDEDHPRSRWSVDRGRKPIEQLFGFEDPADVDLADLGACAFGGFAHEFALATAVGALEQHASDRRELPRGGQVLGCGQQREPAGHELNLVVEAGEQRCCGARMFGRGSGLCVVIERRSCC